MHSVEELFDDSDDPWQTKIYWAVRRRLMRVWNWPGNTRRAIRWAYQRLTRGWDDRAAWSVDYWLDDKMVGILKRLKEHKHGTPCSMFTEDELKFVHEDGCMYPPKEASERANQGWNNILDKMIAAFEASRRIKEHDYDKELGAGPPFHRPKGVSQKDWLKGRDEREKIRDERFKKEQELAKRDKAIFKEGMALFVEHYWDLWD